MAQTIKIKNSGTSSNTPSSLEHGELAINYADGKIFYKNSGNSIVEFSTTGSFLPLSGGTISGSLNITGDLNIASTIAHSGDLDTYFQFNAANTARIVVAGSQKLVINTNGAQISNGTLTVSTTSTNGILVSGNTGGLNFTGGNNRIYFGGQRALEGITSSGNIQIGEGFSGNLLLQMDTEVQGQLSVTDGSNSAPAIRFSSDTNTGIYRMQSDHLGITTGGIRRAYFSSAGIFSDANVYSHTTGMFRNYAGTWAGTTGLQNNGFYFLNNYNNNTTKAMELSHDGNVVFAGSVTAKDEFRGEVVLYANNQDAPYMIAGTSGYTGATTNWNTFGFQHRIKTSSTGIPRVTIDTHSGEAFSIDNNHSAVFSGSLKRGNMTIDSSEIDVSSGDLTLDVAGNLVLDADGGTIDLMDGGTRFGRLQQMIGGLGISAGSTPTFAQLISSTKTLFFGHIEIGDNNHIQLGNGNGDLKLIHDGSNSYIEAFGTGNLIIKQSTDDADIVFESDDGSGDTTEYFALDGSIAMNKFTKDALFKDNVKAYFGDNLDLFIEHDSNNSVIRNTTGNLYIQNGTSGSIFIQPVSNESSITANANGAVDLYFNGDKKLNTKSDGVDITGELQSDSLDVDGDADISGTLTVHTGGSSIKSPLYMGVQNSTGEGGEIVLSGSNSNTGHTLDTVNGSFRIFDNNGTLLSGNSGYGLSVVNGYRVNGTQVITSSRGARNLTLEHGTGGARFEISDWMYSTDNNSRFYFESGARTFYKATTHQFRNTNSSTVFNISSQGHLHIASGGDSNASSTEYIKAGGVAILTNARVLQNVSGNISMFTNDAGYITGGNFVATNADSTVATNKKIQFRDANNFINSHAGSELGVNAEESLHLNAASEVLVGGTSGTAQIQLKSEDIQLKDFTLSGSTVPYADVTQNVTNTASGLQDQTLSGSGSGASNLGSLGIDQGGRIVRHEQEQTFRFSRAQMLASFGGNGITLIPAVGNDKAMIITEMVTMIEFTSAITGGAGTSNPLVVTGGGSSSTMFELRSVPGSFATGVIGAIPRTAFAQATQTTTSGSAPHYGFIYRDLPSGTSSAQKIMCSNNDLKIHKIGTISQMGTGVTAMYIKIRYKIFNGSTF